MSGARRGSVFRDASPIAPACTAYRELRELHGSYTSRSCDEKKGGNRVSKPAQESTIKFKPAHGRRVFDDIVDQIRAGLKEERPEPGSLLPSERQLAEQFGVSRNTVREALRMLEIAGLIEIRKGATGGSFIASNGPDKVADGLSGMLSLMDFTISDLTEVRLWLGTAITRLACERATSEDIAALEENVERAATLTSEGRWEERTAINHQFLDLLATATANPILEMMQKSITELIREIVLAVGPIQDESLLSSRRQLLDHLRSRDADAAVAVMEAHLRRVSDQWLAMDRAER